jgi:hypothetical protein
MVGRLIHRVVAGTALLPLLLAQPSPNATRPFQAQSPSSISASLSADGAETVEIRNVSYEVTGGAIPGRPPAERLLLRKTIHSKEVVGDIGVDASVTVDAWRFGDNPAQKPLYSLTATGTEVRTMDSAILVASRGTEEVDWWSVYKLGSGQHLFDTYVPLVSFSIARETVRTRYVGVEVPPDDTTDTRLKQPNVVAVLTYASGDRVIREALVTCDDARQAALLRSFADATRTVSEEEKPARAVRISFSQNYPSPPNPVDVRIPVVGDDLDLAHAQLPARVHVTAWRR